MESDKPAQKSLGTQMCDAAAFGDLRRMELLLAAGATVDGRTHRESGKTPLIYAVENGDEESARLTLEWLALQGADMNALSARGGSALISAAIFNRAWAVEALSRHGALPDQALPDGKTALHMAALRNGEEAARALLEAGADPLAKDLQGKTPADLAGDGPTLAMLLSAAQRRELQCEAPLKKPNPPKAL